MHEYMYGEDVGGDFLWVGEGFAVNDEGQLVTPHTASTAPDLRADPNVVRDRPADDSEDDQAWCEWAWRVRLTINRIGPRYGLTEDPDE